MLSVGHFLSRLANGGLAISIQQTKIPVHLTGNSLDEPKRFDERPRCTKRADLKVQLRASGLRPVVGLGWNFHFPHRILLNTKLRHDRLSPPHWPT